MSLLQVKNSVQTILTFYQGLFLNFHTNNKPLIARGYCYHTFFLIIMKSAFSYLYFVIFHLVDQPMLSINPARPVTFVLEF